MLLSLKENICKFMINPLFRFIFILLIFSACDTDNSIYYSQPVLEEYHILCNPDSLNYIYTNYKDNTYIPIQIVSNGDTSKARMRIRGDSSRKDAKKSLKVRFLKRFGKLEKVLNFNAEFSDKSYIRQYLSSQIMRASGQNCFQTSFAKLFINGEYFGLYLKVENMDADFLKNTLMDENGNLYKATKDGACMSIFDNLENDWEKKTNIDEGMEDLKQLIANVNSVADSKYLSFIQKNFNYVSFVNMLALNIYLANGSTYYHNYYLYHAEEKWELLPWDMDKTLSYYDWMPYQYHRTSSEWESDNPLIERAFLNPQMFADVKNRIDELSRTSVSPNAILPIIDELEFLLESSVAKDSTDQINSISQWKEFLEKERKFFKSRNRKLKAQFATWPSSFAVKTIERKVCDEILFEWTTSKSPKGKKISYTLFVSSDFLFKDSLKLVTKYTNDTTLLFAEKLPSGKYYWKVTATDGEFFIDGFNSKNVFEIVKCNSIPTTISNTLTLTKQFSPYLVSENINVTKTGKLIIEQGSSVYFKRYSGIMVRGIISILGSAENPVIFRSNIKKLESFTQIYLYGNSHNIKHLKMIKGKIYAEYCEMLYIEDVEIQCGIATWYPDYKDYSPSIFMKFTNSKIKNTHLYVSKDVPLDLSVVEGIVAIGGTHKISTCTFRKIPDAVELTISKNSIISYCQILNSPDDGIDINACENILIINNKITNSRDKGISVGGDQSFDVENKIGPSKNIILKNNIFSKNYIGVSVKDSSSVEIDSCFFYDNSISVEAVEKFENVGGGFINIKNCIIKGKIKEDRFSKIIFID